MADDDRMRWDLYVAAAKAEHGSRDYKDVSILGDGRVIGEGDGIWSGEHYVERETFKRGGERMCVRSEDGDYLAAYPPETTVEQIIDDVSARGEWGATLLMAAEQERAANPEAFPNVFAPMVEKVRSDYAAAIKEAGRSSDEYLSNPRVSAEHRSAAFVAEVQHAQGRFARALDGPALRFGMSMDEGMIAPLDARQERLGAKKESVARQGEQAERFEALARFPKDAAIRDDLMNRLEQQAWKHGGRMDHYPPEPPSNSSVISVGVDFDSQPQRAAFIAEASAALSDTGAMIVRTEDAEALPLEHQTRELGAESARARKDFLAREAAREGRARADAPERGLSFERVADDASSPEIDAALDSLKEPADPIQAKLATFRAAMSQDAPIRGAAEPTLPRVFDDPRQMELPTPKRGHVQQRDTGYERD